MAATDKILEVRELKTFFFTKKGVAKAVNGISFDLRQGEILGIIGESGSGKSVAVKSLLQIVAKPGKIVSGEILFKGQNLLKDAKAMDKARGRDITMIFQEPMTSLNPVLTIGRQMTEGLIQHFHASKKEAAEIACHYLSLVKIHNPQDILARYPHHLSGGMRQRVMIAMALSTKSSILLADEPTTALDVTIQQQIIYLLKELREQLRTSIVFITHDMGVINEIADHTAVMYCGRIQEYAATYDIMKNPRHPYTQALLEAIPSIDADQEVLRTIPGFVPSLLSLPPGCSFSNRCRYCRQICTEREPDLTEIVPGHQVRCWNYAAAGPQEG